MNALAQLIDTTGLPANILLAGVALLGACVGSFLNVVIWRLPRGESLIRPASHCPNCGTPVRRRDNIPVLGWLLLRGRCHDCAVPISARYPLVELLGAGLAVISILNAPSTAAAAVTAAVLFILLVVFFIDLDHQLILDVMTLPGIALGLLGCRLLGTTRADALIGAIGGFASLWLLREGYRKLRGVEGLGFGDVKLAAMLGAWLGWQGVMLTFLVGSFLGTIIGLTLVVTKRADGRTALPYGVFLSPAAMAVTLWGHEAWQWYISL